jgi:hypothetical protein
MKNFFALLIGLRMLHVFFEPVEKTPEQVLLIDRPSNTVVRIGIDH